MTDQNPSPWAPSPTSMTPPQYVQQPPPAPGYGMGFAQIPTPTYVIPVRNGAATAALVLGIVGFVLTPIPVFVGLLVGGVPDILAVVFAIVALARISALAGVGKTAAIWGLVLGGPGFLSMFIGAGTIW